MTAQAVRSHVLYKRDHEHLPREVAARMLAALEAGAEPNYQALWRVATWPPPQLAFHTAPTPARAAIAASGLLVSQPGTSSWRPRLECEPIQASQPPGVYIAPTPDLRGIWAHWPTWDVWQVDAAGLEWLPDELNPGCWLLTGPVSPDRLELVER